MFNSLTVPQMLSAGRIISKKPLQFQLHQAVFVRYVLPGRELNLLKKQKQKQKTRPCKRVSTLFYFI